MMIPLFPIYIVPIIFILLIALVSGVYYYVNCNDEETIEDQFKNWLDDFTLFDKKEEGKIDYHTFYQLLRFINIKISEEEVTNLVKVIDINNDKYIDKHEYLLLMCKIKFSDGGGDYVKEIISKSQQFLASENEIIETKSPVATSESEKESAIVDDKDRGDNDNENDNDNDNEIENENENVTDNANFLENEGVLSDNGAGVGMELGIMNRPEIDRGEIPLSSPKETKR